MTFFEKKGWCPSAFTPMMSGDGLIVRIKPSFSRLDAANLRDLAELSDRFGSGLLDLTSRANLQVRGVSAKNYPELSKILLASNLANANPRVDRLNLVLAPFTEVGSLGWRCAQQIYDTISDLPDLPTKFGFCIDCGKQRYLANVSGDIHIEAMTSGAILLRCSGIEAGGITDEVNLIKDIRSILEWYLNQQLRTSKSGIFRMREVTATHTPPKRWTEFTPDTKNKELTVGKFQDYNVVAVPYGRLKSEDLRELAKFNDEIQLVARHLLILKNEPSEESCFIKKVPDLRLQITICTGAPNCESSTIKTLEIAKKLLGSGAIVPNKTVHISGCKKGCAKRETSDICIVGNEGKYDIIQNGCAWHTKTATAPGAEALIKYLKK